MKTSRSAIFYFPKGERIIMCAFILVYMTSYHQLPIALSIGKNGLTAGAIKQLDLELEHHETIKVNLLRAFLDSHDKKEAVEQLAMHTKSKVVQQVGNKVVLYRAKK